MIVWQKLVALLKWWWKDLTGDDENEAPDPEEVGDSMNGLPDYYLPENLKTQDPSPFGGPALVVCTENYVEGLRNVGSPISITDIRWTHQLTGSQKIFHWQELYMESPGAYFNWCISGKHGDQAYSTAYQQCAPAGKMVDGSRRALVWCPLPQDLGGVKGPFKVEISWRATHNRGRAYVGFIVRKPGNKLVCEWMKWNQAGNGTSGREGKGFHTITIMEGAHFVQD